MANEEQVVITANAPASGDNKSDSGAKVETPVTASTAETKVETASTPAVVAEAPKTTAEGQPAKVEEAKPTAEKAQVVSVDKLKLPENSLVPKSYLEEIVKNSKTVEQAQLALDSEHASFERAKQLGNSLQKAQEDKWKSEITNDPVLGKNLNETDQLATRAFKTLFGEDVFKEFSQTVYSKHPGLIKGLVKFAKTVGEGRLVENRMPPTEAGAKPKTWGQAVYGENGAIPDTEVGVSRTRQ